MVPRFQGHGNEVIENQFSASERQLFCLSTGYLGCLSFPHPPQLRAKEAELITPSSLLAHPRPYSRPPASFLRCIRYYLDFSHNKQHLYHDSERTV